MWGKPVFSRGSTHSSSYTLLPPTILLSSLCTSVHHYTTSKLEAENLERIKYVPSKNLGHIRTDLCHIYTRRSHLAQMLCTYPLIRYRPRFFDPGGHQTTYASIGNWHFFTISCHRQTYQNYEQSRQKLDTFSENKVL